MGVQYTNQTQWTSQNNGYYPYVVRNSGSWVYAGTGFKDGDTVPGIVGYEAERQFGQYPLPNALNGTYTLLSRSTFPSDASASDYSNSSIYQAPSGAWVFASGTIGWSYALDNYSLANAVDPRIQQTTANILNRFITPVSNFTLGASPLSQSVLPGGSTSYNVTISPTGGFSGQVNLSVGGLPSGASGSFAPNPATASSTLSVTTGTGTPVGTYTLTITGISGSLTHTTTVSLVVSAPVDFTLAASPSSQTVTPGGPTSYSVTISPTGGFSGQVNLSVGGLPSGARGTFPPRRSSDLSTLSVTTGTGTPVGTYTLTITGVSGSLMHTTTVSLVVTAPVDFTLAASPSSQTVTPGGSTSYRMRSRPTCSFSGQGNRSVSGLQRGAICSFAPRPPPASTLLPYTTLFRSPVGTYTLTITGVSGSLMHTTTVSLVVTAPVNFTLGASPSSQTVTPGGSTSYSVTISPTGGFSGQVNLSVGGLPSGASGSFAPNAATASSTR